jgi:hypothetical protein
MLIRARTLVSMAFPVVLLAACSGGGAADFSGDYTITVSNGTNDCQFQNWGTQPTSGITVTITQDPSNMANAQLTFTGAWGLYFDIVVGTHIFSGAKVSGDQLDATVLGTKTITQGSCGYTINSRVQLTLTGNTVNGTITYTPATNGDPSCGVLSSCTSSQTISGARPAK